MRKSKKADEYHTSIYLLPRGWRSDKILIAIAFGYENVNEFFLMYSMYSKRSLKSTFWSWAFDADSRIGLIHLIFLETLLVLDKFLLSLALRNSFRMKQITLELYSISYICIWKRIYSFYIIKNVNWFIIFQTYNFP